MIVELFQHQIMLDLLEENYLLEEIFSTALLTATIEMPLFFLFGYRKVKECLYFFGVNIVSNLLLNEFLYSVDDYLFLLLIIADIFVVALEFLLCSYIITPNKKLLKILILTNMTSFFLGAVFFILI